MRLRVFTSRKLYQSSLFCLALCLVDPAWVRGIEAKASTLPTTASEVSKTPWDRIVLIGASVTAGFTETEPLGGPTTPSYRLSRYVEAAVAAPHTPVRNLASTLFFTQPETDGQRQVDEARQAKPTLVLGLDFLFWFSYGPGRTDAERLQRFEQGLKLLESISSPLVVGDIPDASSAVRRMLSEDQIPSAQALAACNRRLKEWAARRASVAVLPLASFMRAVQAGKALTVRGHYLAGDQTRAFLQPDRLHPSPTGSAFLAVTLLDAFQSAHPGVSSKGIHWNPTEVYHLASAQAEARKGE